MKLFYKTSFCCFLSVLVIILTTGSVEAQLQPQLKNNNFTSFTPEKTYTDVAKLTALTPLKYRNHPDFGKRLKDSIEWYEQINKRTLNTRTYIGPGNEIITENSYDNINYIDNNDWMRAVDTRLKPAIYGWSSEQQEIPVYLYKDASTALSIGNNELIVFNKNVHFNTEGISTHNYTVGDNGMYIKDIVPNTDKVIRFGRGSIETDYTIKQPIKLNDDLVISEDVILPSGYTISEYINNDVDANVADELEVLDPNGKQVAELRSPLCYDNHQKNFITGTYHFKKQSGGYELEIQIPSSWLNNSTLEYPVTIDPILVGAISKWQGGKIPSCFTPSFGSGTITDTVPASIAITEVFVQGSYYSPAISKKYGSVNFVTKCSSTGWLTVPDTTKLPGIAYGQGYYKLACCLAPSCSQQTLNVSMEISRDSGGTTCDSTLYIWYDPVEASFFSYDNFESYVIGRTVQDSTWSLSASSICGNQCSITLSGNVYFGVPPYTITHPWSTDTVTFGSHLGCIVRGTGKLTLNIPNCPSQSCKNDTNIYVPPPTISDVCGNVVGGLTSQLLTIKTVPNVIATADTVCSGANVNLTLSSCVSGSTFSWTGSDGSSGSTSPINDSINNNGNSPITVNYTVTPTGGGCTGSAAVLPVTITPFTVSISPASSTICAGDSVLLTASGDATSYSWSPTNGLRCATCASTFADPLTTTTYSVTGTNGALCTAVNSAVVNVNPISTLTILPGSNDTTIFAGQSVQLSSVSSDSVSWSPSTGLSCTNCYNPLATPLTTTTYIATTRLGPCPVSRVITIIVRYPCEELNVPNAFTPGVAPNNYFHILSEGGIGLTALQVFRIYDRWGQKVYESSSISDPGWNGRYNNVGKEEPVGNYVYYAVLTCQGKTINFKGNVTLIR